MEAVLLRGRGGGEVIGVGDSGTAGMLVPGPRCVRICVKRNVNVTALGCARVTVIGGRSGSVKAAASASRGDGVAPENGEFLEQAKAESASSIDDEQEPFRDAVESGQTIGEATTALQFGENDDKGADAAVAHASKKLFQQKKMNGTSEPPKEDQDEAEEVSSEVWGTKDEDGNTHAFLDDSKKIDFQGEDDASVLGIGGQRASDGPTSELNI